MQVSVETTLKWLPIGGGNKPGSPVTVTAESTLDWVWQVAVSSPGPSRKYLTGHYDSNTQWLEDKCFALSSVSGQKGGAVRSKCIVQTPSPFFFFFARWLGNQNKAKRSWDEELQRCASGFAGVHRHVRKRARTETFLNLVLVGGQEGGDISVYILCTSK